MAALTGAGLTYSLPAQAQTAPAAAPGRLSIVELRDASLADALELIFKAAGNPSHIIDESAQSVPIPSVTLNNIAWDGAVRNLANLNNFKVSRNGTGTWIIEPRNPVPAGGNDRAWWPSDGAGWVPRWFPGAPQGPTGNPFLNRGGGVGGTRGQGPGSGRPMIQGNQSVRTNANAQTRGNFGGTQATNANAGKDYKIIIVRHIYAGGIAQLFMNATVVTTELFVSPGSLSGGSAVAASAAAAVIVVAVAVLAAAVIVAAVALVAAVWVAAASVAAVWVAAASVSAVWVAAAAALVVDLASEPTSKHGYPIQGTRTMVLNPIKLTSLSSAALLLGTLSQATFAQNEPAISPSGSAPVPAKAVTTMPSTPRIEMAFENIDVAELLGIISQQFDVQVLVASDVSDIKLRSINLKNQTPEEAIKLIVKVAKLQYRKQDDGTFLIGKDLGDDLPLSQVGGINPVVPQRSFPSSIGSNGFSDALPQLGGGGAFNPQPNTDFSIPALVGTTKSDAKTRQHAIRIRNVPANMMAYWLDPANNEIPIQLLTGQNNQRRYTDHRTITTPLDLNNGNIMQGTGNFGATAGGFASPGYANPYTQRGNAELRSNAQFGGGGGGFGGGGGGFGGGGGGLGGGGRGGGGNGGRGGAGGRGGGGGVFPLPDGVDRVVAIDPQNALLVFGTDEGVRELQDTIQFLDRPLRQVEIECQFVAVNTNDSRAFGIDYNSSQGNFNAVAGGFAGAPAAGAGSVQVGFIRGNFQATLSALLSRNRAKVITAPRVTAINNLTASISNDTAVNIVLTQVSQNINGNQATGQVPVQLTGSISLTVTPTINNDDTVTVLMQPQLSTVTPVPGQQLPNQTSQTLETIANVRDGETIALGGLKTKTISRTNDRIPLLSNIPLLGKIFQNNNTLDNEQDLIIFLTARIIRRAGDDDAVPGT